MTTGADGEALARAYLEARGFRCLGANVRAHGAELDLVMTDPARGELVFVEVRARRSARFGAPEESFTARKRRALARAIAGYVTRVGWRGHYRLDVVGVTFRADGTPKITHLSAVAL